MRQQNRRDFDKEAATWDDNPVAIERSKAVAEAMVREVRPTKDMDAMDFGAGTGLVTLELQPYVRSITAADSSRGMLAVLEGKVVDQGLTNVRTMFLDLDTEEPPEACFDFISTTMTMHHMEDVPKVLRAFHKMLRPGGVVAIADLDKEDGSFHPDTTGVHHSGFGREELQHMLEEAGFDGMKAVTAYVLHKNDRDYPIFLITAHKD